MLNPDWPGWRGHQRNGVVSWLPQRLPEQLPVIWKKRMRDRSLSGMAAVGEVVILSDRERNDTEDSFIGVRRSDGTELWRLRYPAKGDLDYGNSPRATPLIHGESAYLFGAFGDLHCVEYKTGEIVWKRNIRTDFGATEKMVWGTCSSPLIVDEKLIVNPGGPQASLVALHLKTGEVIWKSPGEVAAFNSFIFGTWNGRSQLIGHDKVSLGGWDATTGRRLWKVTPRFPNDFNVPTPMDWNHHLVISTENNGTRLYQFDKQGVIQPEPIALFRDLKPDTHSPVVVGDRLFGIHDELYCLDLKNGLRPVWQGEDPAFQDYTSLVASKDRLLVVSSDAELILIDATASEMKILDRVRAFEDESGVLSHPTLVDDGILIRGARETRFLRLRELHRDRPKELAQ